MALNAGNAACTSGLSQRIYNAWTGDTSNNGFVSPLSGAAASAVKSLCWAIAQAVVAEIQADAVATIGGNTGTVT
jgi:hypothetical protein